MIGSPAPTVASKYRRAPCSAASALRRGPDAAITALLAVTTVLPARSDDSIRAVAGSVPPIASTTIATAGSATTASGSPTSLDVLQVDAPGSRQVAHRDAAQHRRRAGTLAEQLPLVDEPPGDRGSHRAEPEQADAHRFHCRDSLLGPR